MKKQKPIKFKDCIKSSNEFYGIVIETFKFFSTYLFFVLLHQHFQPLLTLNYSFQFLIHFSIALPHLHQ